MCYQSADLLNALNCAHLQCVTVLVTFLDCYWRQYELSYKLVTNYYLKVVQDCAFCMVRSGQVSNLKDPRA